MKRILAFLMALLLLSLSLTGCKSSVPEPEIRSGEFNYSVTYRYGGETKTVSGVYVCEYANLSWALDGGYHRTWSGYIKGGTADDYVPIDTTDSGDEIILVLNLVPDYFMGDYSLDLYDIPKPYVKIHQHTEEGGLRVIEDANSVEELCGAKIISYRYDAPIVNAFS